MAKAQELRDLSVEELEASIVELRKKLFELRNELQTSKKMEKPHEMKETRKGIARVLTVLQEKHCAKNPKWRDNGW